MFSSKQLHASAAGDEALGVTEKALGTTKELAAHAIDRVRGLGSEVKGYASRGVSTMGDATSVASRQLGQYAKATGRYVSDEPVKSALIAAAVGAAVTALVLALRRNSKRYYY
ncbi:hypothetical protein [Ramlibacter sp.]|uniref:hypothetical protein n=1 Tax=Ramlibacter sp. TaxID=1917967 RepID=UPI002B822F9D|nr:hypothetical protein [Ramlibacter sp.]HWI82872.1 hypothetical protein [Ramlibacter sp.]